jgi:hypothetical protein
MRKLMRKEALPRRGLGRVAAGGEDHVAAEGEGRRALVARRTAGVGVGVEADGREVRTEATLEMRAGGLGERRAGAEAGAGCGGDGGAVGEAVGGAERARGGAVGGGFVVPGRRRLGARGVAAPQGTGSTRGTALSRSR